MSVLAPVIDKPNGGRARAAVSFGHTWIYFRASDRRDISRRTHTMLPDPSTRPVLTAEEAFAELGIDRGTGYKAIRDGTFPVPIIRVGRIIRVPTAALRRLLLIDPETVDRSEKS
jgi:predicted DNA-binding transcriptional regulator AlpA